MDRILEPGRNCWRLERAEQVAFLIDGQSYFGALAAAFEQAQQRIFIAGWDIDSRVALERDPRDGRPLRRLGPELDRLAAARDGLEVYILTWDYAMLYAFERQALAPVRLGWQSHRRVHFRADDEHPLGASQHQKFVVIDDWLGFAGGFDLTRSRWDTPAHRPQEPGRRDPGGRRYLPFHDAAMAVSGAPARALAELFRERWRRAGGRPIGEGDEPAAGQRPWPAELEPAARDAPVGLVRTVPAYKGRAAVHEVAQLHRDTIARARRWIYIENQYLTSAAVSQALERRLQSDACPEMLLVLPHKSEGWLEEHTMNALRQVRLEQLRRADRHGRLRVVYPKLPGLDGWLNVHSKLMVADDGLARIGSANLSNRSMGLDSELDLALEADEEPALQRAVAELRNRLLAEHLGSDPATVAARLADSGSLFATVDALADGEGRRLVPVQRPQQPLDELVQSQAELVDPERPAELDQLLDDLDPAEARRSGWLRLIAIAAVLVGLLGLAAAWAWTPLGDALDADELTDLGADFAHRAWFPFALLGVYLLAGVLVFPITVLFVATGILFDPWLALALAMAGALASAVQTYWLGRWLGRGELPAPVRRRAEGLQRLLRRRGVLAVALLRVVPTAPYPVINFAAGALRVRFSHYLLGTALGMAPGIAAVVLASELVRDFVLDPQPLSLLGLVALVALLVGGGLWLRRRLAR